MISITEAELDSIIEGCTKGNSHGEHGVPARLHMDRIVSCLNSFFAGEWKPVLSGASAEQEAVSKAADAGSTPAAPAITEVFIGKFADRDPVQGAAIDHSVRTGAPLFPRTCNHAGVAVPLDANGKCPACNWWGHKTFIMINPRLFVQDLTKRDHLPEGSY